jgi:Trk K+ transport system NAD-binding subunit
LAHILRDIEVDMKAEPSSVSTDNFGLTSLLVKEGSILVGKTTRTLKLRDNYDSILVSLQRQEHHIDPTPDLKFEAGDILWLVGDKTRIATLS